MDRHYFKNYYGGIVISSYNLNQPPRIIFGPGRLSEIEELIPEYGSRPLLVLGGNSFSSSNQHELLQEIFQKLDLPFTTVNIPDEPSPEVIDSIVAAQKGRGIDLVIAIGGGSTLDGGKAISVMLAEEGGVTRFLEGVGTEKPSGKKLPFIAIPTTAGTGSEATTNAVISSVDHRGFKSSLRHLNFIPDLALVDPELTLSCPQQLTVSCGMDCFTQLVEGYLSTNGSAVTDMLALEGIRALHRSLRLVCTDSSDLSGRSDLSYAALLSGIVLCNAGLGTVHGFASAIGGLFRIPHGVVCGTLMAPANARTLAGLRALETSHPALEKYALLGQLWSDMEGKSSDWYQDYFIDELKRLTDELQIAPLSDFGIQPADLDRIVERAGNKYNPVQLSQEELTAILQNRISPLKPD